MGGTLLAFFDGRLSLLVDVFDAVQHGLGLLAEFAEAVSGYGERIPHGLAALATQMYQMFGVTHGTLTAASRSQELHDSGSLLSGGVPRNCSLA